MKNSDRAWMSLALRLARRGYGTTSPNPMVGAVLVRNGRELGRGYHHRAGLPHAEIEALRNCAWRGNNPRGATVYVTLEPCSTQGRTPACTSALLEAGIRRVVAGATDPNPKHCGAGFALLRQAGLAVETGVLAEECAALNEAFNHWVTCGMPFVTVKAAMTLDGKIATASGQSKWITGEKARHYGMRLRRGSDAILVGVNTVLADNPSLTYRGAGEKAKTLRRIILDTHARTPLDSRVTSDTAAGLTTVVVGRSAPAKRVAALGKRVSVMRAPLQAGRVNLKWLMRQLGNQGVSSLLVEGGGEVNASFLLGGLAQRIAFFYAPKILGGNQSLRAVGGEGATQLADTLDLTDLRWRQLGEDLLLTARVA
jgi:diaminohydroxyphosphoribosylaminopyrimidine deaminase / 5-amino-6-(5-phosphoribosylamino)uracil reductase